MADGKPAFGADELFTIGSVCFARIADLPYWPAVVTDGNPENHSPPVLLRKVELYNEAKDVHTVHIDDLLDFQESVESMRESAKLTHPGFMKACDDAEYHLRAQIMSGLPHIHPATAPVTDEEQVMRSLSGRKSKRLKGESIPEVISDAARLNALGDQLDFLSDRVGAQAAGANEKMDSVLDAVLNAVQPLLAGISDLHGRFQRIETSMKEKFANDEKEDETFAIGMRAMKSKIDQVVAKVTSDGNEIAANERGEMLKSLGAIHSALKKISESSDAFQKSVSTDLMTEMPKLKDTIARVQKELKKKNKMEKKKVVTSEEFEKMKSEVVGTIGTLKNEMASVADMHKMWIQELKNDLGRQEKEHSELQKSKELIKKSWVELGDERAKITTLIEAHAKQAELVRSWQVLELEREKLRKAVEANALKARGEHAPSPLPKKMEINRQAIESKLNTKNVAKPTARLVGRSSHPRPKNRKTEEEEFLDGGNAAPPSRKKRKRPATKAEVPKVKRRAHFSRTNAFSPTLSRTPFSWKPTRSAATKSVSFEKGSKSKPGSGLVQEKPTTRKGIPKPKAPGPSKKPVPAMHEDLPSTPKSMPRIQAMKVSERQSSGVHGESPTTQKAIPMSEDVEMTAKEALELHEKPPTPPKPIPEPKTVEMTHEQDLKERKESPETRKPVPELKAVGVTEKQAPEVHKDSPTSENENPEAKKDKMTEKEALEVPVESPTTRTITPAPTVVEMTEKQAREVHEESRTTPEVMPDPKVVGMTEKQVSKPHMESPATQRTIPEPKLFAMTEKQAEPEGHEKPTGSKFSISFPALKDPGTSEKTWEKQAAPEGYEKPAGSKFSISFPALKCPGTSEKTFQAAEDVQLPAIQTETNAENSQTQAAERSTDAAKTVLEPTLIAKRNEHNDPVEIGEPDLDLKTTNTVITNTAEVSEDTLPAQRTEATVEKNVTLSETVERTPNPAARLVEGLESAAQQLCAAEAQDTTDAGRPRIATGASSDVEAKQRSSGGEKKDMRS